MRFQLSETLLAELRACRAHLGVDPVETEHDAFCLDGGLGPAWYLTADGRVLMDGLSWNGEPLREATEAEALQTIVVGAKKTGIDALLELLPRRPQSASTCTQCDGGRYASGSPESLEVPHFICPRCNGLGWT